MAAIVIDARGLELFALGARSEVGAAISMIASLMTARARDILTGAAPAALPKLEAPPRPPPASKKKVPTRRVFTLEHVKWRENDEIKVAGRYSIASIPEEFASRSIERGLADDPDTSRARQLLEAHGGGYKSAHPDDAFDLETGEPPSSRAVRSIRYGGPR